MEEMEQDSLVTLNVERLKGTYGRITIAWEADGSISDIFPTSGVVCNLQNYKTVIFKLWLLLMHGTKLCLMAEVFWVWPCQHRIPTNHCREGYNLRLVLLLWFLLIFSSIPKLSVKKGHLFLGSLHQFVKSWMCYTVRKIKPITLEMKMWFQDLRKMEAVNREWIYIR